MYSCTYFWIFFTHIIVDEVRMVLFNAIIQDGHYHTSSCVALSPGCFCVQVLMCWVGLEETQAICLAVNPLWLTLPQTNWQARFSWAVLTVLRGYLIGPAFMSQNTHSEEELCYWLKHVSCCGLCEKRFKIFCRLKLSMWETIIHVNRTKCTPQIIS